jgi:DNA-binding winged helix-turn-helix (wHTH) protein
MAAPAHPYLVIRFGEFELIAASAELRKAGIPLKIHPQPFRVLLLLAERPGQIVTRDEIRSCLWGDNTFVDFEGGINSCVKQIRDVLADDVENPRYLHTIPRRGYRFIASTTFVDPTKHPILLVPPAVGASEPRSGLETLNRELEVGRPSIISEHDAAKSPRTGWRRPAILCGSALLLLGVLWFGWYLTKGGPLRPALEPTQRQLTANSPEDYGRAAAISPDGKYLAYVDQTRLLVRSVASGEIRPISLPADFPTAQIWELCWFPEGGKLLATRRTSVAKETSLWMIAVVGEAPPKMLREETSSPAISPDGKLLAF